MMWNLERIQTEHKLRDTYGLKNLRELWIAASELRRVRGVARNVLSGKDTEETGKKLVARLARYGIVKRDATVDDLLVINVESLLDRRLESVVFKRGLAKSPKQARQLIVHGFISVDGHRLRSPGHLVTADEENKVKYYKAINLDFNQKPGEAAPKPAQEQQPEAAA